MLFFHQPTELQAELHRRNHWHPGHGAMGDTRSGTPCMGTGNGIVITGFAPPDQVIVQPDDAATQSGEAIPRLALSSHACGKGWRSTPSAILLSGTWPTWARSWHGAMFKRASRPGIQPIP